MSDSAGVFGEYFTEMGIIPRANIIAQCRALPRRMTGPLNGVMFALVAAHAIRLPRAVPVARTDARARGCDTGRGCGSGQAAGRFAV